jgi:hypothetical protein
MPDAAPSSPLAPAVPAGLARPPVRIPSEHSVLDRAQRALEAGDPATALAAIEEHARLFHGAGVLAQQREELRALALGAAGVPGRPGARSRTRSLVPGDASR